MKNSEIESAGKILAKLGFKERYSNANECLFANDEVGVIYQDRQFRLIDTDSGDDISPSPHDSLRDLLHEAGVLGYVGRKIYVGVRI